jgi:hypothetical protein
MKKLFSSFAIVLVFSGCGALPSQPNFPEGAFSDIAVVFSKPTDGTSPIVSQTDTSMTFSGVHNEIQAGKVIISTVGNGALRKVQSSIVVAGNTVVQTEPASLGEAFKNLDVKLQPDFSQASFGDISSPTPGLTLKWISSTTASTSNSPRAFKLNNLEIGFNGLPVPNNNGSGNGISITGKVTMDANPELNMVINQASGSTLPSIASLRVGSKLNFHGSITVDSQYGGDLTASGTWLDLKGTPQVFFPLVFVPHLKIESSFKGTSAGKSQFTENLDVSASAFANYSRDSGWTIDKQFTPQITGSAEAEAEFGVEFKPVDVTLSYDLYNIAGPYLEAFLGVSATGKITIQNSVEGINAVVKAALGGEAGLKASIADNVPLFGKLFDFSWTPVSVPFTVGDLTLYEHFFPFVGTSSITVGDNGPAPDDVFSVAIDGVSLGQTTKGGTGAFRVTSLSPGAHTLTVVCLDDGANGADVGTLGIALSNLFTFSNGSTSISDQLSLGQSKDYMIIVPTAVASTQISSRISAPPRFVWANTNLANYGKTDRLVEPPNP